MDSIDENKVSEYVIPIINFRCCKCGNHLSQCCQGIIIFPILIDPQWYLVVAPIFFTVTLYGVWLRFISQSTLVMFCLGVLVFYFVKTYFLVASSSGYIVLESVGINSRQDSLDSFKSQIYSNTIYYFKFQTWNLNLQPA